MSDNFTLGTLITLALGSYAYTTGAIKWLLDKVEAKLETIKTNHIRHLEDRVKALEDGRNRPGDDLP